VRNFRRRLQMVLILKLCLGDRQWPKTADLRDAKYCDVCMYLGNYMYLKLGLPFINTDQEDLRSVNNYLVIFLPIKSIKLVQYKRASVSCHFQKAQYHIVWDKIQNSLIVCKQGLTLRTRSASTEKVSYTLI
jgi:hypothetical protein